MNLTATAEGAPRPSPSVRQTLREATAGHHARVDTCFSAFDLGDPRAYGEFLLAQWSAFASVEAAVERSPVQALLDDWPKRRRAHLLAQDIAGMDLLPPPTAAFPDLITAGEILGAVYVLEGSRLGGRVLARSVRPGLPRAFLTAADPALWRRLVDVLETQLASVGDFADARSAACQVFELFEAGAMRLGSAQAVD